MTTEQIQQFTDDLAAGHIGNLEKHGYEIAELAKWALQWGKPALDTITDYHPTKGMVRIRPLDAVRASYELASEALAAFPEAK